MISGSLRVEKMDSLVTYGHAHSFPNMGTALLLKDSEEKDLLFITHTNINDLNIKVGTNYDFQYSVDNTEKEIPYKGKYYIRISSLELI